jgi:hypothetical protein
MAVYVWPCMYVLLAAYVAGGAVLRLALACTLMDRHFHWPQYQG